MWSQSTSMARLTPLPRSRFAGDPRSRICGHRSPLREHRHGAVRGGRACRAGSVRRTTIASGVRLAVGDIVVYGPHGAGPVTARENKIVLGTRQEVIELELTGGLRVELLLERAQELLRPLATESDLGRVEEVLRADQPVDNGTWLKRKKESLARLNDGDPIGLAQIIRDGAPRDAARTPKLAVGAGTGHQSARALIDRDRVRTRDRARRSKLLDRSATEPAPVSDDGMAADAWACSMLCARCIRAPRDPADRATWVSVADGQICPGCVTQSDRERLRMDERP
jgi:RNA polymerase-interacting CarD/CdnL/TRCF family regulator